MLEVVVDVGGGGGSKVGGVPNECTLKPHLGV